MRLHEDADDDLRRLDPRLRERIIERLKLLGAEPRGGPNCTAVLTGYRLKVGNYRARYFVNDDRREVLVARVLIRNERTYR